jgi:glycogen debranching enzyme
LQRTFSQIFWLVAAIGASESAFALEPVARFPIHSSPLAIIRPVEPTKPFTVAGEHSALFGEQNGTFEAWLYPVKILSGFRITAELAGYPIPIDVTALAASIEVTPAATTITYSHAAFTVKQRMFATRGDDERGQAALFEFASVRPLRLTFRFQPEMLRMWPAPSFGKPNAEWVEAGGYYILHTDDPDFSAAVAMSRATAGILPPYQERPKSYPLELKLEFDPKRDAGLFFPLLLTLGGKESSLRQTLEQLNQRIPELYRRNEEYYAHFFETRLACETPDPEFDRAFHWAEIAVDQGKVTRNGETGLIAGYYESGDSARPGYSWFFGRDALWTSFAVNSYGDFALTRQALEFLIRRQRADGKIMHEYSQTAGLVDWASTPYFYAAADSTPLFVMAMEDYVNISGDIGFLRQHWDAVRRAWAFLRMHDSDGDGIYENTEGTGWVESWPQGMPHQEIYLAALDQQAASAMSRLAALVHDLDLSATARHKADEILTKLEAEYYDHTTQFYAFSRNADGSLDSAATVFPAVAWWSGRLALPHAEEMLNRWASNEFSTDWGTRDLSNRTPYYDPISYHQGSVWPLFTGWVSLAEYRAGRTLAGYQHLMQNAGLTWSQDLGAVTELLSGEFFQPLGRSSSHQIWSSAMVVTPALRGLFGLDWDVPRHILRLSPHLPATWNAARLRHVPFGETKLDIEMARRGEQLVVRARSANPARVCLVPGGAPQDTDCAESAALVHELTLGLPPVEVAIPTELPLPGSQSTHLKAVSERQEASRYVLVFEAPGGSEFDLPVRFNRANVRTSGAELRGSRLHLQFPLQGAYPHLTVTFSW